MTTVQDKTMVGETLRNGAIVLAHRPKPSCAGAVLCDWRGEYVTWCIDREGNAFWGHYFQKDLVKAAQDFVDR